MAASRALAVLRGRSYVVPQDTFDVARDVLRHRLILSYEALAKGLGADEVLNRVLAMVPAANVTPLELERASANTSTRTNAFTGTQPAPTPTSPSSTSPAPSLGGTTAEPVAPASGAGGAGSSATTDLFQTSDVNNTTESQAELSGPNE